MRARRQAPWWVIVSDIVLINASMAAAYWVRYELQWLRDTRYYHSLWTYVPFSALFTALMLFTFKVDRVYQQWRGLSWLDHVYHIVNAAARAVVILFAVIFFLDIFRAVEYSRALFLEAGVIVIILLGLGRAAQNAIIGRMFARGIGVSRVIIVGAGEIGRTVMRTIVARPELGYQIVGFVDDNPQKGQTDIGRFKALGGLENLPNALNQFEVDEVIITLPWMYHRRIMSVVRECERRRIAARIVPDLFQMSLSRVDVNDLGGVPLIGVREVGFGRSERLVKRLVDIAAASVGLVLCAPLFLLVALAIRLDSPGPVIFSQTRVGANGKLFRLHKFRSMREGAEDELAQLREMNEADGPLFKIHNDPRMTRVGRVLRRTSIDELPQLWNVLRGEMSMVGPRPALPSEVEQYQEWHKKRLEVRPGLTGLWQVRGRCLLSFDEGVLLDIYYIENWSLWLDFKIMLLTVPHVLFGDGAY